MSRLIPVHWKVLECIFKKAGFSFDHQRGSHRVLTQDGCLRPLIIPRYEEIDVDIIRGLMRTAGMSRKEYFQLLYQCK